MGAYACPSLFSVIILHKRQSALHLLGQRRMELPPHTMNLPPDINETLPAPLPADDTRQAELFSLGKNTVG